MSRTPHREHPVRVFTQLTMTVTETDSTTQRKPRNKITTFTTKARAHTRLRKVALSVT